MPNKRKEIIGEKTVADAILYRLVYSSHRLEIKGESVRKRNKKRKESENDQINREVKAMEGGSLYAVFTIGLANGMNIGSKVMFRKE